MLAELADVYEEHYGPRQDPFHSRAAFVERFDGHVRVAGFRLVTARDEAGVLAGFIYGYPLPADTGWWTTVLDPLPPELTREDGRRTISVNELNVRRAFRRNGIATALHAEYLRDRPSAERATLSVEPDNAAAYAAYRRWGYQFVARDQPLPQSPIYDDLVLPLPR